VQEPTSKKKKVMWLTYCDGILREGMILAGLLSAVRNHHQWNKTELLEGCGAMGYVCNVK
jgi:hypothetical protein